MSRIMDADALEDRFDDRDAFYLTTQIKKEIRNAPTLSPDEVRGVGEWIDMADFEQCSVCKGTQLKEFLSKYGKTIWIRTPYCPNCGAMLRNGGTDDS